MAGPPVIYTLEGEIQSFFNSHPTITRQQCDSLATSITGDGPVIPVPIQGNWSYTVSAGPPSKSKIVQFRDQASLLDPKILKLAKAIHGDLVAEPVLHGEIGSAEPVAVYVMEKIEGKSYIEVRDMDDDSEEGVAKQENTVRDLAKFFAQSWIHKQITASEYNAATRLDLEKKLERLTTLLPQRFTKVLQDLKSKIPLLFSENYPFVLAHGDLCELNTLADPATMHITGIIDWADAKILPFGLNLSALDNCLGYMNASGWHYGTNRFKLERSFWQTFGELVGGVNEEQKEAIEVARTFGIFLAHGLVFQGDLQGEKERVAVESDSAMKYLDALIVLEK